MNPRHIRVSRNCWVRLLMIGAALCLFNGENAQAHPMGNFAICHYTRLQADKEKITIRYILDFAEIPTVAEKRILDSDGNGIISAAEERAYLATQAPRLLAGLMLRVNDRPATLRQATGVLALSPGAGGLETLQIRLDLDAPLPPAEAPYRVPVSHTTPGFCASALIRSSVSVC